MPSVQTPLHPDHLATRVEGPVFVPGSDDFAQEVASFNLAITHTPELVVGVTSVRDIQESIQFARENGLPVSVIGGGHSTEPIDSGVAISTRRLDEVQINPADRTATFGAGVRWGAVIDAAAEHGLHPVTGSSPLVGAVGYLLGGGLGPLARSHGVSSDYLLEATIITSSGDVLTVNAQANPELLWALRGGKYGFGVVANMTIRLVSLNTIHAGSLTFGESDIAGALSGWLRWTRNAPPDVSTSAAALRFPDLPVLPDHLRGRHLLSIRFAYPGSANDGEVLAAPLRSLAEVESDTIRTMPVHDIASIHNDPTTPGAVWLRGALLGTLDDRFADALLDEVGVDRETPFNLVEIRHLGGSVAVDVEGGSSFNGRDASYVLGYGALNPATFDAVAPEASTRLLNAIGDWTLPDQTVNFIGNGHTASDLNQSWTPANRSRLDEIRKSIDPTGLFRKPETRD